MNTDHITTALYRQSLTYGSETRAELEAQLETNGIFLTQSGAIMVAARGHLEHQLRELAKISESQYGALHMVGEVDFSALHDQWKIVDKSFADYTHAGDVVTGVRERIDDILLTLKNPKLWANAVSTDELTRKFARAVIKETL